ncbi:MAG: transcriptional regulator [Bacillota bacterium]
MECERILRIGDKLISLDKGARLLERVIKLRAQGVSQQEVAHRLSLDRSFISRLESIGEIRKGKRVAVLGFPIQNTAELTAICRDMGLEFVLLLNNRERWSLVGDKQALDFFNEMFDIVTRLKSFDTLVLITSEKWYRLAEALLDTQIVFINLGATPVQEDRLIDPAQFQEALKPVIQQ